MIIRSVTTGPWICNIQESGGWLWFWVGLYDFLVFSKTSAPISGLDSLGDAPWSTLSPSSLHLYCWSVIHWWWDFLCQEPYIFSSGRWGLYWSQVPWNLSRLSEKETVNAGRKSCATEAYHLRETGAEAWPENVQHNDVAYVVTGANNFIQLLQMLHVYKEINCTPTFLWRVSVNRLRLNCV